MSDRGLLMEARGKKGIVMTRDGRFEFVTIPSGAQVGDEIGFETRNALRGLARPVARRRFSAAAIAATLVIGLLASLVLDAVRVQRTAVAYVEVDINPSVEFGVNRYNRVVSVEALDDEGRSVVENLDLRYADLENAVETLTDAAEEKGFLGDEIETQTVVITVTPAKGETVDPALTERVENARQAVSNRIESRNAHATVQVIHSDPEVRRQAKMMNIPPGRLAIMLKAMDKGVEVEVEAEKPEKEPREKPGEKHEEQQDEKRGEARGESKRAVKVQIVPPANIEDVLKGAREEKDWQGLFKKYGEDIKKEIKAERPWESEQEIPPKEAKDSEDEGEHEDENGRDKNQGDKNQGGQDKSGEKNGGKKSDVKDNAASLKGQPDDESKRPAQGSSIRGTNLWERWRQSLQRMRRGEKPDEKKGENKRDTGENRGR